MPLRPSPFVLLLAAACQGEAQTEPVAEDPVETEESPPQDDSALTEDSSPPEDSTPPPPPTLAECFGDLWDGAQPVDYAGLQPVMGRHCMGTNHQDIQGVERVVILGDSIAVGTPPTRARDWWRNRVADATAQRFGLDAPGANWRLFDPFDGMALETFSGDYAACAKFGARTDDLLLDPHKQAITCMPEETRALRTLVLIVMGGNDIFSLLEEVGAGTDEAELRAQHARAAQLMREAVEWIVEPGRFPNGVYVVLANTYDFSDPHGAEDMARCEGAELIGMSPRLRDPVFQSIIADAQREYLEIAIDTGTDLLFLGEMFCGHGYARDDTTHRCYRGPSAELYLDLTCEHPSADGHAALTEGFLAVIDE